MTEYGLNLYWRSLLARIATLESYGFQFLLSDDGEDLSIRVPKRHAGRQFCKDAINAKSELLEAVRLREGLCVTCGMDAAKHPSRKGKYYNWNPETLSVIEGDCSSLAVHPMWCVSCWDSRAMWRGLVEKRNAQSKEEREAEAASSRSSGVRREQQTTADLGGDSGGDGLGALSFTAH